MIYFHFTEPIAEPTESSPGRPPRPKNMLSISSPNVLMHENKSRPSPPPAPHRGQTIVVEPSAKGYESKPVRISTFNEGQSVSALKEKLGNEFVVKIN